MDTNGIEVKRNCSSSIRTTLNKITFGDFTITIDGDAFKMWRKVKQLADKKTETEILSAVICAGLLSLTLWQGSLSSFRPRRLDAEDMKEALE